MVTTRRVSLHVFRQNKSASVESRRAGISSKSWENSKLSQQRKPTYYTTGTCDVANVSPQCNAPLAPYKTDTISHPQFDWRSLHFEKHSRYDVSQL